MIAGQGTLGLELVEQLPEGPGTVVVPVGGGGLASGVAIALAALRPELRVVGVQAAACAPLAGHAPTGATIADGIAVKHPGELTGAIVRELVDELVVVDDEEISQALVLLLERAKLVVEGAGAAPDRRARRRARPGRGAGLRGARRRERRRDDAQLRHPPRPHLLGTPPRGLAADPRPARPARPRRRPARAERANVLAIEHHREGRRIGVLETEAELTLETRGEEHSQLVIRALAEAGYTVRRLQLASGTAERIPAA